MKKLIFSFGVGALLFSYVGLYNSHTFSNPHKQEKTYQIAIGEKEPRVLSINSNTYL
jgi:hypothetical protein